MANELKCTFGKFQHGYSSKIIQCTFVEHQTVYNKHIILPFSNKIALQFNECFMLAIPSANSIKYYIPNLSYLNVFNSKVSKITADDLKGFDCLRDLYVTFCEIEYLPGDLFKHTQNLEIVSFRDNNIKYIGEGILDQLRNLKVFNLSNNVNIDAWYDIMNNNGNVTLAQMKNEIKTKCFKPWKAIDELKKEIAALRANNQKELREWKVNEEAQKKEIAALKARCNDLERKFEKMSYQPHGIKQVSKNFTIIVNERNFLVNKAVLITHSPVLAKLVADDPEADNLELKDISEATFKEILNFMNDGSRPRENANMVFLLSASFKLEINGLTAIVAEVLKKKVNQDNALDVLYICNKFDTLNRYHELKMKANAEFQKSLNK